MCKYCTKEVETEELPANVAFVDDEPIEFGSGTMLAQITYSTEKDSSSLDILSDSGFHYVEINYCPMCGEKLT